MEDREHDSKVFSVMRSSSIYVQLTLNWYIKSPMGASQLKSLISNSKIYNPDLSLIK